MSLIQGGFVTNKEKKNVSVKALCADFAFLYNEMDKRRLT